MPWDIGLLGCGAIGMDIARLLTNDAVENTRITAVHNRTTEKATTLVQSIQSTSPIEIVPTPTDLLAYSDIVIEAASPPAVPTIVTPALHTGVDTIVLSAGAFNDPDFLEQTRSIAEDSTGQVFVPSGAIGGLDAVRAAAITGIDHVSLTAFRNPSDLDPYVSNDVDPTTLGDGTVVFEDTAEQAITAYPNHMNIAISLALAANVPATEILVTITVDGDAPRSHFVIKAESPASTIEFSIKNYRSPFDTGTNYSVALSAVSTLRRITDSIVIGT